MEVKVNNDKIKKVLQKVAQVVKPKNTIPALDNILVETEGKDMIFSATDLRTYITYRVQDVDVKSQGKTMIEAKILSKLISSIANGDMVFISNKDESTTIKTDTGEYHLPSQSTNDFPVKANLEECDSVTVDSLAFKDAVGSALLFTGNDELRPAMSSVYLDRTPTGITVVATDAHKMFKKTMQNHDIASFKPQLVFKDTLIILNGILPEDEEVPLEILYDDKNIHFVVNEGEVVLSCKKYESKYVSYEGVIPKTFNFEAKVNREALMNAIKRLSVVSDKTTNMLKVSVRENVMTLEAEDVDYSREGKEVLPCECEGGFIMGFNSVFLQTLLSDAEGEEIKLCMNEPSKPAVIKSSDEEKTLLLMPVMLNS